MTTEQVWLAAPGAVGFAVALVALLVAARTRGRAVRAEEVAASLTERLAVVESRVPQAPSTTQDAESLGAYVITRMDSDDVPRAPARPVADREIDGRLFADIVARETVVKAASWTHGLRRALSPESRNRIRFGMRQASRQSGRERKAEMKQALREYRARAEVREDVA